MIVLNQRKKSRLDKQKFCIVSEYFTQFDLGLSGVTTYYRVILKEKDNGFNSEEEALSKMKELGLKSNRVVKGARDEGQGSIGSVKQTVHVCTVCEALESYSDYSFEAPSH